MQSDYIWNIVKENLMKSPEVFGKIIETLIVLAGAVIVVKILKFIITKFFHKQKDFKYTINDKRADTLSTLLTSLVKYIVYAVAALTIINSIFKVNLTTILTAAGIGTVVLGIWAQSLVKDIISGFFILMEDQFAVGDSITVDDMSGMVEEIELRITKIRHFNGDLIIIPNGEIKKVINHTRGNKTAIVDVHIPYEEDLDKVIGVLNNTLKKVEKETDVIVEEPKVLGVTEFGASDITIRVIAKTLHSENVEVERKLRKNIKEAFDREKIIIPYTSLSK